MKVFTKFNVPKRGTIEKLKRFCSEGLKPVSIIGGDLKPLELNKYGEINFEGTCWIENTMRGFVDNPEVYFDGEDGDINVIYFDARFAWEIESNKLLETFIFKKEEGK